MVSSGVTVMAGLVRWYGGVVRIMDGVVRLKVEMYPSSKDYTS